jgi:hypothetical protein
MLLQLVKLTQPTRKSAQLTSCIRAHHIRSAHGSLAKALDARWMAAVTLPLQLRALAPAGGRHETDRRIRWMAFNLTRADVTQDTGHFESGPGTQYDDGRASKHKLLNLR